MKKLMVFLVICISMVALVASPALASWGGGIGNDAVEVTGTVTLVDGKYWITGQLVELADPGSPSQRVINGIALGPTASWELDFGKQGYYKPASFGTGTGITIQGKLCKVVTTGGEIDVYSPTNTTRTEGGPRPWHPHGGPPGQG